MMFANIHGKLIILLSLSVCFFMSQPEKILADESLGIYGLKGYAYTYSPLPANGFYIQSGYLSSQFNDKYENGDGSVNVVPLSLTYGDGRLFELAVATHYEMWENTDLNVDENGIGDVFVGMKLRLLGFQKDFPFDLALEPYALIATGNRDIGIGDIYYFNPSNEDDNSYGLNILFGKQFTRLYLSFNLGINFVNTDLYWIDDKSLLFGAAAEYQISETWTSYVEFLHSENKINLSCDPCQEAAIDEDYQLLGAGIVWIKNKWGIKLHAGTGLTDLSPSFQGMALVNRNF